MSKTILKSLALLSMAALVLVAVTMGFLAPVEGAILTNLFAIGAIWVLGLILAFRISVVAGLSLWALGGAVGAATATALVANNSGDFTLLGMMALLTSIAIAFAARGISKVIDLC